MKKIMFSLLAFTLLFVITGCGKKCDDGFYEENNMCVSEKENMDLLQETYVCDGEWHLEGTECVQGEMPKMGNGCEPGTTDRVGADGFCHHYKDATIEYSCSNNGLLKDNKCYETREMK